MGKGRNKKKKAAAKRKQAAKRATPVKNPKVAETTVIEHQEIEVEKDMPISTGV